MSAVPDRSSEAGVITLLEELRSLFGRVRVSEEDRIRVSSLRAASELSDVEMNSDAFLAKAEATITIDWNLFDERSLQLINKTNQFNLNGVRLDEATWRQRSTDAESLLLGVSYTDKFSPLGKIGVLLGRHAGGRFVVDSWVLSCRAFSRRIEHAAVQALFEKTDCQQLEFQFQETSRNGPLQSTFQELTGKSPVAGLVTLSHSVFQSNCPAIFAKVISNDPRRNPHAA